MGMKIRKDITIRNKSAFSGLLSILKMIPPVKLFSNVQLLISFVSCFRIRIFCLLIKVNQIASQKLANHQT